jgi:hypothetical protein
MSHVLIHDRMRIKNEFEAAVVFDSIGWGYDTYNSEGRQYPLDHRFNEIDRNA